MAGLSVPAFVQARAPAGKFRRADISFDKDFTVFEEGEISGEQLLCLVREPRLEVQGSSDGESYVTLSLEDFPHADADPVAEIGRPDDQRIEELERQAEDAQRTIDDLEEKLKTAESSVSSLTSQVASLQSSLAAANDKLSKAEIEAGRIIGEQEERIKALEELKIEDISPNGEVSLTPPPAEPMPAGKIRGKPQGTAAS